jgi:ATP-dependent exoDNAse (exonuclease V) alpha subunit
MRSLAERLAAKKEASSIVNIFPYKETAEDRELIASIESAVNTAKYLTGIDNEKIQVQEVTKRKEVKSLRDMLDERKKASEVGNVSNEQIHNVELKNAIEEAKSRMSLAERIADRKKNQEDAALALAPTVMLGSEHTESPLAETKEYTGAFALNIVLNERQLMAKELALAGKSFCLIGAAGTGKTTTQRSVAESLLKDNRLTTSDFKLQGVSPAVFVKAPSIAFCAYTRRATANLQRAIHKDPNLAEIFKFNCMTIHALLEYVPYEYYNDAGEKCFRFEPTRTKARPLNITHLVLEESSQLGLDLWEKLYDALPPGVQIIFIGDINQLPPVFGASILNYALVQLPIIELSEVYRQQGDSLVLENAHNILGGRALKEGKGFKIIRGKAQIQVGQEKTSHMLGGMFRQLHALDEYDPNEDIILSPYNKQPLGTKNMNNWIAQFLGEERGAVVHEVIAGYNKLYLAEGDKVMYNKMDAFITKIAYNSLYHGKRPQEPGTDLSRFGVRIMGKKDDRDLDDILLGYENFSVDELADTDMERKQQCSHVITLETDYGTEVLSTAAAFADNIFDLGYILTVHKAQGCEWRRVYIILHKDHANLLSRELFYTAVTRAREEVILIAKDAVIEKAINTQKIKGSTLEDKVEYFNSGALDIGAIRCTK